MQTTAELEWNPTMQAILGPEPALQLYGQVSIWFHKVGMFRKGENQRLYEAKPTARDLEIHKDLLLRLIADGEHLQQLAGHTAGMIDNPENIKLRDLTAALETLRDTFRGWHQPIAQERRQHVLNEVFSDVS